MNQAIHSRLLKITLAVSVALMSGCAALTDPKPPYKTPEKKRDMVKAAHPETYIRVTTANQRKLKQLVPSTIPILPLLPHCPRRCPEQPRCRRMTALTCPSR